MQDFIDSIHEILKGYRTILVAWFVHVLSYFDTLLGLFSSGIPNSKSAAWSTALMALVITLKQIVTDVIPKLQGRLDK